MRFAAKQLAKQLGKNRVFLVLLFLLTCLTSISYFFPMFSIDGNMAVLNDLEVLNENQRLYESALNSNTFLTYNFLASMAGLTIFVIVMFFYRFFRTNKKMMGCLKALGFKDNSLRMIFVGFIGALSVMGTLSGMLCGFFLSGILIQANMKTYSMTGLVKGINLSSIVIGIIVTTAVFCITAFLCYCFVPGKGAGNLIAGNKNTDAFSGCLKFADKIVHALPVKNKFPLRIALRKPVAVLLILFAVMSFCVCIILGRSLNISSQKVFKMQTNGHNYEYDTQFPDERTLNIPNNSLAYLETPAEITANGYEIDHSIIGLYELNQIYELHENGTLLSVPKENSVYINPGLAEIYGVNIGDTLTVKIAGNYHDFLVAAIAENAKSAAVYVNAYRLTKILSLPGGAYNGLLGMDASEEGTNVSKTQRLETLERNAVSNNVSGVINQVIGGIIGCILIFLALFINFQDNTRDMLILHMTGYRIKEIRRMLINVYLPVTWLAFFLVWIPSVMLAQSIQRSLSISTEDYMPFGTGFGVMLGTFALLNVIYWIVQMIFNLGIKRVLRKEDITEYTAYE